MGDQQTLFVDTDSKSLPLMVGQARYLPNIKAPRYGKHRGKLLVTQPEAAYYVGSGQTYGILCRRFEDWYIKAIMAYLKQSGINAVYEKMHEKGLGFTGYLIKRK